MVKSVATLRAREANQKTIPGAEMTIVKNAGHFLSLDAPDEVLDLILGFSAGRT